MSERVNGFLGHMHELIQALEASTHKLGKQRDANDHLSQVLQRTAEAERICMTLKAGMISLAKTLSIIEDHRQALIDRTEAKVLQELCQTAQSIVSGKESIHKMLSPKNTDETSKQLHAMHVDRMEEQRICDLKRLLSDLVIYNLNFHCKSIELLTATHRALKGINEQNDLTEFRRIYKINLLLPSKASATLNPLRTSASEQILHSRHIHHSTSTNSLLPSRMAKSVTYDSSESLITTDDEEERHNKTNK